MLEKGNSSPKKLWYWFHQSRQTLQLRFQYHKIAPQVHKLRMIHGEAPMYSALIPPITRVISSSPLPLMNLVIVVSLPSHFCTWTNLSPCMVYLDLVFLPSGVVSSNSSSRLNSSVIVFPM